MKGKVGVTFLSEIEPANAKLRQMLEIVQAQLVSERSKHEHNESELTAKLAQATHDLVLSKAQQLAAQELIENSQHALNEQRILNETRNHEIKATEASIQTLEQRLILSEAHAQQKIIELSQLQQRINTLQQNPAFAKELAELQLQAQQLLADKKNLEEVNQQLSTQCTALKARLEVLETERISFAQHQQSDGLDMTQLKQQLETAQILLNAKESEWKNKVTRAEAAGEALKKAKADVEHKAELLEIHLNLFKKHGLPPKERIFQNFLADIKRLIGSSLDAPICYISYAWEDDKTDAGKAANLALQAFLLRLERDLKTLGITVFLDVTSMNGNITDCMSTNIARSNYFLLIGTERLQLRVQDSNTNVGKEWIAIAQRMQHNPGVVIPLLYKGEFDTAFPPAITKNLIRDFRQQDDYHALMAQMQPMGLIRSLLGICLNGLNQHLQESYLAFWEKLEAKFSNIELELKNETLLITSPNYSATPGHSNASSSSSFNNPPSGTGMHGQWQGRAPAINTSLNPNTLSHTTSPAMLAKR